MPDRKRVNVVKGTTVQSEFAQASNGQHFLASDAAALRIVEAFGRCVARRRCWRLVRDAAPSPTCWHGKARRLIAVELDRVLSAQLRMKFNMQPNVEIIEGDILTIELDTVFGAKPGSLRTGLNFAPEPVRVVGNLPYYITSDIVLRLLEYHRYFSTIVIMVQKEVADRLAASAGSRDYGLLSATAQLYGRIEQLFTLPPAAFSPPPKVHSSVVRITIKPRLEALRVPEAEFIAFLKLCFGQKRKTLWNNLKTRYDEDVLRAALAKSGVKPAIRAEALPIERTAALFRALGTVESE